MAYRNPFLVLFLMLSLAFVQFLVAEEDDFNLERLPLGNPATKYSFGAVKLDQIYDSGANRHLSQTEFFDKIKGQRIVMVGESHTNPEHHLVQYKVVQGLVAAGKQVCLALEMFTAKQNQALNDFITGKFAKEDFMDSTGWFDTWGYNYRMYQPIFEFARENNVKIYGVNMERDYVSKIGRNGLKGLSAEEQYELPSIDTTNVEHRFLIKAYFSGSDAITPEFFANKYLAQCAWDAVMAEGAIKAAKENPDAVVVILAGSGHVTYNLGIGKVIENQSELPFVSVIAVEVPAKKEESLIEIMHKHRKKDKKGAPQKMPPAMAKMMQAQADSTPHKIVIRSLADYLWGVPDTDGKPAFPSLGIRIGDKTEEGIVINNVYPKSLAEKNEIEDDDIIVAVDGKSFSTKNDFKKYLQTKNWDDPIKISLLREGEKVELDFVLKWEKEENE